MKETAKFVYAQSMTDTHQVGDERRQLPQMHLGNGASGAGQVVGSSVPDRISSDSGRKLDNAMIRIEMKNLYITWHLNTPEHPKSRGSIKRLHGTLSDHLPLYHIDKGLEPDVAMPKAIAAYNHSIHTATGFSPFEIGLQGHQRYYKGMGVDGEEIQNNHVARRKSCEKARERMEKEKTRRVGRENLKVTDIMEAIRIGTIIYRKLGSNIGKEIQRYEGPFRVMIIREHNNNTVTIESINEPKKKRTVHIEELKLPAMAI
ncbi:uncharacterized protein [Halyomorpha halys]|uniref:uncharacterized protein n=1 Tax=Halyomorpha halys TaxID=286706 RepID=UPI0034D32FE1